MKKFDLKNFIISLIVALCLVGTTIFVCVIVLKDNGNDNDSSDNTIDESIGSYDPEGWTDPE